MLRNRNLSTALILLLTSFASACNEKRIEEPETEPSQGQRPDGIAITSTVVDSAKQDVRMFLNDKDAKPFRTFANIDEELAGRELKLVFAMNAGMFNEDRSPVGWHKENGTTTHRPNKTQEAYGNFFLQPNGVFYLTRGGQAVVCETSKLTDTEDIVAGTQSGPMLLIDSKRHPAFRKGSTSVHIRNGVGILPDGKVLFAISDRPVNLHDFATFFLDRGCRQALYFDGAISKARISAQNRFEDGDLGPIIGVVVPVAPAGDD